MPPRRSLGTTVGGRSRWLHGGATGEASAVSVRRTTVVVGMVMALSVIAPLTEGIAHPTTSFEACAARTRTSESCLRRARYTWGDTVFLRAKVTPAHAGFRAAVLRRDPGSNVWMRVDAVRVSDRGRMWWRWKTTFQDADRHDPYTFKFQIHGVSSLVWTWVLYRDQHPRSTPPA